MRDQIDDQIMWNVGERDVCGGIDYAERTHYANRYDALAAELAETKTALAESFQDLEVAARQIAVLEQNTVRRRGELKHLVQREAQARVFGYHDELTGLANRRLPKDRLKQAMAQAARQGREVALILLDLDDFKSINDQLGHPAGDQVLRMVAARLVAGTRAADTTCRYGGDESAIMLPEVDDIHMVDAVASKLQAALTAPIFFDRCDIRLTASAGRVVYPDDGASSDALMRTADQGLYRAKAARGLVSIKCPSGRIGRQ